MAIDQSGFHAKVVYGRCDTLRVSDRLKEQAQQDVSVRDARGYDRRTERWEDAAEVMERCLL